jgi:predicted Zn finger-like uncharacterized protein
MLITCPECQFARNINASSIPSKAQLATCPRCKTKFRFRILHDEDQVIVESVENKPVAQNFDDELDAAAKTQVANEAFLKKAAGDSLHAETTIEDDYVESEMVAAMQEEIEQLLKAEDAVEHKQAEQRKQTEKLNQAEHDRKPHAEKPSFDEKPQQPARNMVEPNPAPPSIEIKKQPVPHEDAPLFASDNAPEAFSEVVSDEHVEMHAEAENGNDEKQKTVVKRSASAQALRERGVVSIDATDAEDEAVRRYEQEKGSSVIETASAHIVPETEAQSDIWDAISAMGNESECTESFAPGCGAQVNIIPWEDSRLSFLGRVTGTFSSMFVHPVRFWRGINAKPLVMLPMLFSFFMCVLSCVALAVGLQMLVANWTDVVAMLQSVLPQQELIPDTLIWFDIAPTIMVILGSSLLLLPLILGAVTAVGARLLGGDHVPFSTGVKTVSYSSGAFCWLLIPVLGAVVSLMYLPLLYVSGVRTGYNLSLFKSVVLVGTVLLLFAASVLIAIAAGVTFM